MSAEDEQEDAEYWAAVEQLAAETLRPYLSLLPAETLEMMKYVMVATVGAHPEVEALTREIVRGRFARRRSPARNAPDRSGPRPCAPRKRRTSSDTSTS